MPALDERKGRAIKSDDGLIVGHAHPVPQTSLERTRWLIVLTMTGAKSWDSGGRYGARAAIKEFANEQGNAVLVEYHGREVSKVYPDLDRFAPVSGGLHEEAGRIPNRKQLGLLMQNWHSGMGDPVYAVGSYYFADKPYPDPAIVEEALDWFETVTGRDARDTREIKSIVSGLRYFLKHDYAGARVAEEAGNAGKWFFVALTDFRDPSLGYTATLFSRGRPAGPSVTGTSEAEAREAAKREWPGTPEKRVTGRGMREAGSDPDYVIQVIYSNGVIASELGEDDEATAIAEAKSALRSFGNDEYARVITRDGELVWDSRRDKGSRADWKRKYPGAREAPRETLRFGLDPTSDHATIQRMIKFYTEQKGIGDYVDNSAIPMGNGVWQFHTRPFTGISTFRPRHGEPRSGIEKHEATHAELARAWKSKGVSETGVREAGRRRTPTRVPFVPDADEPVFTDPASIERFIERELAKHGDVVRDNFRIAADDAEKLAKKYDSDVRAQDRAYPGAGAGKEAAATAATIRKSEAMLRKASKGTVGEKAKKKTKKRKAK